jgi:hypothetical protein
MFVCASVKFGRISLCAWEWLRVHCKDLFLSAISLGLLIWLQYFICFVEISQMECRLFVCFVCCIEISQTIAPPLVLLVPLKKILDVKLFTYLTVTNELDKLGTEAQNLPHSCQPRTSTLSCWMTKKCWQPCHRLQTARIHTIYNMIILVQHFYCVSWTSPAIINTIELWHAVSFPYAFL